MTPAAANERKPAKRRTPARKRSAKRLLAEPSPSDWERWEERLAAGQEPSAAAMAVGYTSSQFRRLDPGRHRALLDMSHQARAELVDRTFDDWALAEDAAVPIRLAWAKRWNPAYSDKSTVEMTGPAGGPVEVKVDVTFPQLQQLLAQRAGDAGRVADSAPLIELPAKAGAA